MNSQVCARVKTSYLPTFSFTDFSLSRHNSPINYVKVKLNSCNQLFTNRFVNNSWLILHWNWSLSIVTIEVWAGGFRRLCSLFVSCKPRRWAIALFTYCRSHDAQLPATNWYKMPLKLSHCNPNASDFSKESMQTIIGDQTGNLLYYKSQRDHIN